MGKIIRLDVAITDTNAPRIPHTAGVGGYSHRYIAGHVNQSVGTAVSSWADLAGELPMNNGGGTPAVMLRQDASGFRYLESSTANNAGGQLTTVSTTPPSALTFAAIIKLTASGVSNQLSVFGASIGRLGSGQWELKGATGTILVGGSNNWALVIATVAGASSEVRRDALTVAGTVAPFTDARPIMYGGSATPTQPLQLAEVITWDRALTAGEKDAVRTSLKAAYTVLP